MSITKALEPSLSQYETTCGSLQSISFKAFGGTNSVAVAAHATPRETQLILDAAKTEALRIQSKYSRYEPESVLSRINASAGMARVTLDSETDFLLSIASHAYAQSNGYFDITSGVLRRAWNFTSRVVPSRSEIDALLPLIGWSLVEHADNSVYLPRKGMELDLGGIGKEYAVDRVAGILEDLGVAQGLINFGGDVRALGKHPMGRPWQIGIRHPRRLSTGLGYSALESSAIATSGDYERFFESEGVRYCHLLNPFSGVSKTSFASVSICAPSCLVAGILSSTAMLLPREEAIEYLQQSGVEAIVVTSDGEMMHFQRQMASFAHAL
jgi:thiamine biosynthesis lipoprotein